VLVAPAMNTTMLEHPATRRNIERLRADGVRIIEPDQGEMACGTIGPGRLSEPGRIVEVALDMLQCARHTGDLAGERILITAGATREPIDPVRFISNRSSGRMGYAIAKAAHARGAEVTVVSGVTSVAAPAGVGVIGTTSANEMHRAVMERAGDATIFIAAAAVADYASAETSTQKVKKTADTLELTLQRTPDILREVAGTRRQGQLIIGFAAETENLLENAWEKLVSKDLDAIVANDVSKAGGGFDSANNAIAILFRDRPDTVELPLMPKEEAAHRILDEVVRLRKGQSSARSAGAQKE
jgi:phosphopantothenoylcysteine decarboxylase / phosphopantothenate---cysteine ligase